MTTEKTYAEGAYQLVDASLSQAEISAAEDDEISYDGDDLCNAFARGGYGCTRRPGHSGPHVAGGGNGLICRVWPASEKD